MPGFFIHNGKFNQEHDTVISPDNRGFRYGDGIFETIRVCRGSIPLWQYHHERLFHGLRHLKFDVPKLLSPDHIYEQVLSLLKKNKLTNARIRITFYRGNGGITDRADTTPGFIIQSWPMPDQQPLFNENGLRIGIYRDGFKSADALAPLKSNSFLLYSQAALFAQGQKWNDAIVLNHFGRISDTTIANIFWTEGGKIFTPPLSEGPIAGVMRRFLLENNLIHERQASAEELAMADEIFLTNAVRGIQWVSQLKDKPLSTPHTSLHLFRQYVIPLFASS